MNKSYTDLEQSKKLAEILPLESADMIYTMVNGYHTPFVRVETVNELDEDDICVWSLAALLGVIPKHIKEYNTLRIDIGEEDFSIWYDKIGYGVIIELPDITMENPVDACYEMIIKLHELKML